MFGHVCDKYGREGEPQGLARGMCVVITGEKGEPQGLARGLYVVITGEKVSHKVWTGACMW